MKLNRVKQAIGVWCIRKIQKFGPRRVEVLGREYETSEEVFNPKYYITSEFMARHIRVNQGDEVLDMGTGSGVQAITAAREAARVVAVDINPEAVKTARRNVRKYHLERVVAVHEGDLFSPLGPEDRFDVILFTPPYLEGTPETFLDRALFDRDKELARRFFSEAGNHLKPNGYVQMIYSSIAGPDEVIAMTEGLGWRHDLLTVKKRLFETFLIYRLTPYQKERD